MSEPKQGRVQKVFANLQGALTAAKSFAAGCLASPANAAYAGEAQPVQAAQPAPTLAAQIEPQSLAGALKDFATQTGLQLIYVSQLAEAQRSAGAPPGLSLRETLTRLLNLRAVVAWKKLEAALFINNALDSQPVFGFNSNGGFADPILTASTFRPRTIGLSATGRL